MFCEVCGREISIVGGFLIHREYSSLPPVCRHDFKKFAEDCYICGFCGKTIDKETYKWFERTISEIKGGLK